MKNMTWRIEGRRREKGKERGSNNNGQGKICRI